MNTINTQTHTLANGYAIRILIHPDENTGAPWDMDEGHGPVSDWSTRDKRPGEWILNSYRGAHRFYDAAEAARIAERDGWGLGTDEITGLVARLKKADASELTRGEIIAEAVRRDFDFLRGWCNDEWSYIGFTAELMHERENGVFEVVQKLNASCWGFEDTRGGRSYMLEEAAGEATREALEFLESIEGIESALIFE
jgi:hypothetical protein